MGLIGVGMAWAALSLATAAGAAELGFSDGLSAGERAACGIARLTPAQVGALNALVEHDVILARQGGVSGFATAFSARHSARERAEAGIDALSDRERAALDGFAARAVAMGPPPMQVFTYEPPPPAPPRVSLPAPHTVEVHGDLSLTVGGGGHGSSFYGASADVFVTDPTRTFTVGVGVAEFRARGWAGPYGPYGLYCAPYAGPFP